MNKLLEVDERYEKLKEEFETYQSFAESTIQMLSSKNTILEKNLDAVTNILEISKYINSNISEENFISMINDMIIGILGVSYSSIYVKEKEKFVVKATNIKRMDFDVYSKENLKILCSKQPFVINFKLPKSKKKKLENQNTHTHSVVGVPINLRDKLLGYIVVEHTLWNFFNADHIKFISSIANQIGIALENNSLYKKIKESSVRDPFLDIYNRKYFFNTVESKISNNRAKKIAIVMLDIDDFKKHNDKYGHQFGDKVLLEIIRIIKENISENDILARYGGEEIIIFINEFENEKLLYKKIDNIRMKISNNMINYNGSTGSATASFGIAYYTKNGQTLDEVVSAADRFMYIAKKLGKNRVVSK